VSELRLLSEIVAHQAGRQPAATAVHAEGGGDRLTFAGLDRRSNRLGRALVYLGVRPGDRVVILCCDHHLPDRLVALVGAQKAAAVGVALIPDRTTSWLAGQLMQLAPRVVLACSEGVDAWQRTGVPCLVVGDEPGVTWWKLIEARQAAGPFQVPCRPDDVVSLVS
jgi:acyl-CoA synthetase (AMP-forming)/AMP-acid ligase II